METAKKSLRQQTQQLLDGPLKHVRGAALAAALLPLASVAAAPASAQTATPCASGGTCGTLFNDLNGNAILDAGDTPIQGYLVTACDVVCTPDSPTATTGLNGNFQFSTDSGLPSMFTLYVVIPTGTQPSPLGPDNIGNNDGSGFSFADVFLGSTTNNFGFVPTPTAQPGTGTPGYWKNHPEAWPVSSIMIGSNTYTKAQAISRLSSTGKDKSVTMFQSYVSAYLSIKIGNDGSCVSQTMTDAYNWLVDHPVGSNIAGGSAAWAVGQPIQSTLDAYDNGLLCAPHRK